MAKMSLCGNQRNAWVFLLVLCIHFARTAAVLREQTTYSFSLRLQRFSVPTGKAAPITCDYVNRPVCVSKCTFKVCVKQQLVATKTCFEGPTGSRVIPVKLSVVLVDASDSELTVSLHCIGWDQVEWTSQNDAVMNALRLGKELTLTKEGKEITLAIADYSETSSASSQSTVTTSYGSSDLIFTHANLTTSCSTTEQNFSIGQLTWSFALFSAALVVAVVALLSLHTLLYCFSFIRIQRKPSLEEGVQLRYFRGQSPLQLLESSQLQTKGSNDAALSHLYYEYDASASSSFQVPVLQWKSPLKSSQIIEQASSTPMFGSSDSPIGSYVELYNSLCFEKLGGFPMDSKV